ncbi:MAG TPA: hypothetical protein VFR15_20730 [Chloroflexia bacterium]|nr:hypothetical protein [Chloroflexia bacterium]
MRRLFALILTLALFAGALSGCGVPQPPPELPTPTPGSQNPENDLSALGLTPVRATPDRGYTPLAGPAGTIYFVRGDRLWAVNPDGSGERGLAPGVEITGTPSPSPDGKLVAWVGGRDLYVMPSVGGEPRSVYTGDLTERQRLGWSADGTLVGFLTYDTTAMGVEKAWAVPAEGGEPILVTALNYSVGDRGPTYERTVQWSRDGHWVVVGAVDNSLVLLRWPLGPNGQVGDIAGGEPDWSPDSRTLLYTESLNGAVLIYGVLEAEATPFRNEKLLVGTGLGQFAQGPGPRWSPASVGADSDLLVYRTRTTSGEPSVAVRTRGGRDLNALRPNTNNPAWSPNGDSLVVETGTLTADPLGPKWAPNGLAIATISLSGEHTLKPLVADAKWPAWGK